MKNVTKGEFKKVFTSNNERAVRYSGGVICWLFKPSRYSGQDERYEKELEEAKDNQELIHDAFVTYNSCSLSPSELKQRLEIAETALKRINQYSHSGADLNAVLDMKQISREAIQKLSNNENT